MNNPTPQNDLHSPEVSEQKQTSEKKAAWQKPEVQRLRISMDTAFFGGSNVDGTRGTTIIN